METTLRTLLAGIAVACLTVGCTHLDETPRPTPSWLDPAAAPPDAAELRYLVDIETGRVLMEVPPPVLASVRLQLVTTGHEDMARQLGVLYDLQTGRVRDPARAKAAEVRIRGPNAPPISQPPLEKPPPGASPTPPLPPALPVSAVGSLPGQMEGAGGSTPGGRGTP
jgi:hypothetical protein